MHFLSKYVRCAIKKIRRLIEAGTMGSKSENFWMTFLDAAKPP